MGIRGPQKRILQSLLQNESYPTAVAVHGPRGTGKTTTISQFLHESNSSYSWVKCDQCATARILLQRALRNIFVQTETGKVEEAVCENVDIFLNLIKQKFQTAKFRSQHVLVLDRIDRLPDYRAMSDLFSCLSRIPELTGGLANLVVVFVYSTAEPRALITNPAVPRIWFPRFTIAETLQLLEQSAPEILVGGDPHTSPTFQTGFLELVMNAFGPNAGTDISLLKRTARKIWPEFSAHVGPGDSVAKIYVRKSYLFAGDKLVDRLEVGDDTRSVLEVTPLACYLICAAYLASYNSPRYDMRYFSLAKTMRNKRRETRPKKTVAIPARSLAPPAFEMERLLAIYHAINPMGFEFQPTASIGREIATLEAQKLITKSAGDPLDSRTKWKVNVPWSYVQRIADEIGFNIEDYLVEV